MKLRIIMADPAGNRTAIVRTPVPADQRAQIAAEILKIRGLRAEQVGFETLPVMGGAGRLDMMGGEFCGNAARSYGYLLWKEIQEKQEGKQERAAPTRRCPCRRQLNTVRMDILWLSARGSRI